MQKAKEVASASMVRKLKQRAKFPDTAEERQHAQALGPHTPVVHPFKVGSQRGWQRVLNIHTRTSGPRLPPPNRGLVEIKAQILPQRDKAAEEFHFDK